MKANFKVFIWTKKQTKNVFPSFKKTGQKFFVCFLVQMKALKFAFDIYWLLEALLIRQADGKLKNKPGKAIGLKGCPFLFGYSLMTAWWFCDNCLKILQWLPSNFLTTTWQLPDNCLMTSWWLSWWRPDNFAIAVWQLYDKCLMSFVMKAWQLCDICLKTLWQLTW